MYNPLFSSFNVESQSFSGTRKRNPHKVPSSQPVAIQLNIPIGIVSVRRANGLRTYHVTAKSLSRFYELAIDLCLLKDWHCSPTIDGWILIPPVEKWR